MGDNEFQFVVTKTVKEQLQELNICICIGLNEIYPRMLKELAGILVVLLSTIYYKLWDLREVPGY